MNESGAFGIGRFRWHYGGEGTAYGDVDATDLGLESRALSLEAGEQGRYGVSLEYRGIPRWRQEGTVSPFRVTGEGTLGLLATWAPAGTTAGMSSLAASLRPAPIRSERERFGLSALFIPTPSWQYDARYRHEETRGVAPVGGAFLIHSAVLPAPLDQSTDQFDLGARYAMRTAHVRLAYHGSLFRNRYEALHWENPYTPLAPGADEGQLAVAPDNQFHQLSVSGSFDPDPYFHVGGRLARGRASQDELFLPATVNPNLATPLPRHSLDGVVDVTDAALRATYRVTRRLRVRADYVFREHDNRTPPETYTQVVTDTFTGAPRTSLPYSFRQETVRLGGDLRFPGSVRLSGGYEEEARDRTHQAVAGTEEHTAWARLRASPVDEADVTLTMHRSRRTGSGYTAVPEIQPPPNPLQRISYLADRDRLRTSLRVDAFPRATLTAGLSADFAEDEYRNSPVGLRGGTDVNVTADATATIREFYVLSAWASRGQVKWEQAGSQAFASPDWSASSRDITDAAGLTLRRDGLFGRMDVVAGYVWTESSGETVTDTGGIAPPFPDFHSRRHRLDLSGTYEVAPGFSARLGYAYERYRSDDWQIDDVLPDTIANVLAIGETSPRYGVHVVGVTLVYRFRARDADAD